MLGAGDGAAEQVLANVRGAGPQCVADGDDHRNGRAALVALTLMFGWDANLVLAGRRFLLTIDDEPFPALVTDRVSEWFTEAAKNLDFKVSPPGSPAAE